MSFSHICRPWPVMYTHANSVSVGAVSHLERRPSEDEEGQNKDKRTQTMKENIKLTAFLVSTVLNFSFLWWYMLLIPAVYRQRQIGLCEFEDSLVCILSSRPVSKTLSRKENHFIVMKLRNKNITGSATC